MSYIDYEDDIFDIFKEIESRVKSVDNEDSLEITDLVDSLRVMREKYLSKLKILKKSFFRKNPNISSIVLYTEHDYNDAGGYGRYLSGVDINFKPNVDPISEYKRLFSRLFSDPNTYRKFPTYCVLWSFDLMETARDLIGIPPNEDWDTSLPEWYNNPKIKEWAIAASSDTNHPDHEAFWEKVSDLQCWDFSCSNLNDIWPEFSELIQGLGVTEESCRTPEDKKFVIENHEYSP